MPRYEELAEQILDRDDGSCRDVNFDHLDWHGAAAVVESLLNESSSATATDGHSLDVANMKSADICNHAQNTRTCHLLLKDVSQLFGTLQIFICSEDDGSPFVELTFFPNDVLPTFTAPKLIGKLIDLATLGGARDFFLRYENASWDFGTTGHGTGVITTWLEIQNAT